MKIYCHNIIKYTSNPLGIINYVIESLLELMRGMLKKTLCYNFCIILLMEVVWIIDLSRGILNIQMNKSQPWN